MNDLQFKVIPTLYNGIEFRSRLEARWALFMDLIGVKWAYEPEGYQIGGDKYLPDFFLYRQNCFYEIKPAWPTNQEAKKCESLAMATGRKVFLQHGPLLVPTGDVNEGALAYWRCDDGMPGSDITYLWAECKKCGYCELQFEGRSARNSCRHYGPESNKEYNEDSPKLVRAYHLADSERFGT